MRLALEEAARAAAAGDVPIGAVILGPDGEVVARGHNRREARGDATAHAEIEALREASERTQRWRLERHTLVVTLEPCVMCAGALVNARIGRLVYGCHDEKAGAVSSLFVLGHDPRLNHRFPVTTGVLASECSDVLRAFFAERRARR
ncbi:MAG: nucleoside deaminase [Deltaproteobacteria bacterium]|nr:nucleoside deaminase [Deltaproteobacteria bacterium]